MRRMRFMPAAFGALLASASVTSLAADPVADFYAANPVRVVIGASVGSGYDVYARLLARHIGRHIPGNPGVIAQNMEGAGGVVHANHTHSVASKDGATVAAFNRTALMEPLYGNKSASFDPSKFQWLGSMNKETVVCVSWHDSGIKTVSDLKEKEFTVGAVTRSDNTGIDPRLLNAVLGTKMKVVTGYSGTAAIKLAMERGEVQGRCGWAWESLVTTSADWIRDTKIHVLIQMASPKNPELPTVPSSMDLATTEEQRQILALSTAIDLMGRPFAVPAGVPPERVAALRSAFAVAVQDKALLAEAEKMKLKIDPISGEEAQKLIERLYATPKPAVEKYLSARQ